MSEQEARVWWLLGFNPLDPEEWPVMAVASRDLDIAAALEPRHETE